MPRIRLRVRPTRQASGFVVILGCIMAVFGIGIIAKSGFHPLFLLWFGVLAFVIFSNFRNAMGQDAPGLGRTMEIDVPDSRLPPPNDQPTSVDDSTREYPAEHRLHELERLRRENLISEQEYRERRMQ